MNLDDFKKLLDESLKPIKQDLSGVKRDLTGVKQDLSGVKQDLSGVKQDLNVVKDDLTGVKKDIVGIKGTLEDHTNRLEALAGDVHNLQDQTKAVWDKVGMGHDRNKREIDEIKTHLGMPIAPNTPQV